MSERLVVIIPVENMVRELDVRLLIAALWGTVRERIFLVSLGYANTLASLFSGGIYWGKNIGPTHENTRDYLNVKAFGYKYLNLSEEGAVFFGDEDNWERELALQLSPSLLESDDYVATWGEFQRDYFISYGAPNPGNIISTGHPKFSMLKGAFAGIYQKESDRIRGEFGRFILFNSNYSSVNNPNGHENTFSPLQCYSSQNQLERTKFLDVWCEQNRSWSSWIQLINLAASLNQDYRFVIRPHPAEDDRIYRSIFKDVPNVSVCRSGSVIPWILACDAMVHNGCTTAIEAGILRKRVVTFVPKDSNMEIYLANLFGERVSTLEDACKAIRESINKSKNCSEFDVEFSSFPARSKKVLSNLENNSIQPFIGLLNEVRESSRTTVSARDIRLYYDSWIIQKKEEIKSIIRPLIFPGREHLVRANKSFFGGFNSLYILEKIKAIREISGRDMRMVYYGPELVELVPQSGKSIELPI